MEVSMKTFRPIAILRLEAVLAFAASLAAYRVSGGRWSSLALYFFLPDASILPYLISAAAGWASYNAVHSYAGPLLLAGLAWSRHSATLWAAALIWSTHVSFDRLCGFGLKEGEDFWVTHLGTIEFGRALWNRITRGN
jgi:hypothetical protein